LTGLSHAQCDSLLPVFSDIYRAPQQHTYKAGLQSGMRRRRPGGGSTGKRPTRVETLQFVLYSYKTYPPFDVLGTPLAMARSKAKANLQKLSPMLYDTLVHLARMPYCELATPEEVNAALQGVDRLRIAATARAYHRSADDATQREPDRGKKQHTLKHTVMSLPHKFLVFLGRTFSGPNHDYLMLKQEFPPELDWLIESNVRVDWGSRGIQSDYRGDRIAIPTKKPRQSKKNPSPQLSDAQKATKKALSQIRIFIEPAIGGMKRYNILVHVFRNRKADFEDDAVGICAGLWNFALYY
jgi:DDE superfamily endonuclease